ncbi:hypothetical protein PENSPDRAFT_680672 [Peniophora sp. CONT]|nr:hypothetical protein PENSPDRAFT_680672 [Peniophora sp. CONT]
MSAAYAKHAGYPPGLPDPSRDPTPVILHGHARSLSTQDGYDVDPERSYARTPSPTPSENELLRRKGTGFGIDRGNWRKYFTRAYILRWVIIVVVILLLVLGAIFMQPIVRALKPTCEKVKKMPVGFLIPIAVIIALSFPPLLGAELIHVLCGLTWGAGIGFGIVAAGTIIGEISVFYAFRQCWRARAEKYELTNIKYGVVATVIRQGGFFLVVMCRLSSLPAHFTTVVFTVSGVNISVFASAVVVSLVKVLPTVYAGTLVRGIVDGDKSNTPKIISFVAILVSVVITIIAMIYIDRKVNAAKPAFVHARRKARQPLPIRAVDGEGFQIAAPEGQKAHGPPTHWVENDSQESLFPGYAKQAGPSQYPPPVYNYEDGRV